LTSCRGHELLQRPTAHPVSITLGKDLLQTGLPFRIPSAFSQGEELFEYDFLVAVSVVLFEHLDLRRLRGTRGSNPIAVARRVSSWSVTIARGVAANGSGAISPVTLAAAAHLAKFSAQLCHFVLELCDHAIQRRFAFRLRPEAAHRLAFSSSARLGRIAPLAIPFTTNTRFRGFASLSIAFTAGACFG